LLLNSLKAIVDSLAVDLGNQSSLPKFSKFLTIFKSLELSERAICAENWHGFGLVPRLFAVFPFCGVLLSNGALEAQFRVDFYTRSKGNLLRFQILA